MPPKDLKQLKLYFKNLGRRTNPFPCTQCGISILPKDYEKHWLTLHNLNTKLNCVWCEGNVSWKSGEKCNRVDHLLECFRKFMALCVPPKASRIYTTFDLKPMCPAESFFGHCKISFPRAFEPIWPMPLDPILPAFQDDNLNLAVSCIRKYLDLRDSTEWFHIMVRSVAFPSFLKAMDEDEGKTQTLPFSCWCDGGTYKEARHRQHRHMIVISPKEHFIKNVWEKVTTEDRPCRNFPCIRRNPIKSSMHLVNALGYLSQRESRCNFSFKESLKKEKLNHFYIFKTLPSDYKLVLVLQWDGGIMELIRQEFQNLSTGQLLQAPIFYSENRWHLKVKDLPGIKFDIALPVSEYFAPVRNPTDTFLHLTGGKKLYYSPDNQATADTMPLFYNVVGEDFWDPRPFQQKMLTLFKPIVDQNTELRAEFACLKRKYDEDTKSLQRKVNELNEKIQRLYEDEIARLKKAKTCIHCQKEIVTRM